MHYLLTLFIALLIAQPVLAATAQRGLTLVEKSRDSRKRVALIIGNGAYLYPDSMPRLTNPANARMTWPPPCGGSGSRS